MRKLFAAAAFAFLLATSGAWAQTYDYTVQRLNNASSTPVDAMSNAINNYAANGWTLVFTVAPSGSDQVLVVFRREHTGTVAGQ